MKMGQKTYVNDLRANMLTDFDLATTKFSYLFIYNFNSIIVMINPNCLSMTLASLRMMQGPHFKNFLRKIL